MVFDWDTVVCEAMTRRPELRRQKLKIQRREMELLATRNFLKPRLDVTGQYRLRGFGHDLAGGGAFDPNASGGAGLTANNNSSTAWGTLLGANYQEYQAGVEFSMMLGMRQAHAAVHAAELTLARERVVLEEQERQVIHDLTNSKAEVDRAFSVVQTNLMRFRIASDLVDVLLEKAKSGNPDFDRLLFAQSSLVNAESSYFLAQVEFEVAMKNLYYERNALLDYYGMAVMDGVGDDPERKSKAPQTLMKSNSGAMVPEPAAPPPDNVPAAPVPAPPAEKP
jgi:outer membrane protein TolC